MPLEPDADLQWTAFLYITGDLAPDEEADFERLLGDDQEARDAVAGAVELAGALAIVGPDRALILPRRRPIRRIAAVLAMAAAACLAVAIPMIRSGRPPAPDASEVAAAWTGLRAEAEADWIAPVAEPVPADEEVDASSERALPSWLLTAASASRAEAPAREED